MGDRYIIWRDRSDHLMEGQTICMSDRSHLILEGQVSDCHIGGTGQIRGQSGKRERMEKDLEQGEAFELRALRGLGIEIKLARVPKRRIKKLPIETSRKTR